MSKMIEAPMFSPMSGLAEKYDPRYMCMAKKSIKDEMSDIDIENLVWKVLARAYELSDSDYQFEEQAAKGLEDTDNGLTVWCDKVEEKDERHIYFREVECRMKDEDGNIIYSDVYPYVKL